MLVFKLVSEMMYRLLTIIYNFWNEGYDVSFTVYNF